MPATIVNSPNSNPIEKQHYTTEEYLTLEEKAEYKHEYRDGEIVAITGGTTNHNEIAG